MGNLRKRYNLKYEKFIWCKLSNQYVIVVINEGFFSYSDIDIKKMLYFTTKSGIDILNGLLAEKSTEEIIKALTRKFGITIKQAKADFKAFINQLLKKDLLEAIK